MIVIGHRGCGEQYPENTLQAIEACAPHVDLIELDVMRCGSGELVVFHDEELDRLTSRSGRVDETEWEILRDLTVGASDERIPLFREAVDQFPDGTGLNLDLVDPEAVSDAVEIASAVDEMVLLSTTHERALEYCRDADDDTEVLAGYSFTQSVEKNLERAVELGCEFVHVPYPLCLETSIVSQAHAKGLRVDAWTVATSDPVPALRERGVDAITVDRWDILSPHLS